MNISVIIPVYNVEPYVGECLRSVAAQTWTEGVECIVVDDRGQDGSWDAVERFAAAYRGPVAFRLLRHERNGGLSAARNTGLDAAAGEYVYFLDSDDCLAPDCLASMWGYVERHGHPDYVQGSSSDGEREGLGTLAEYAFPEYSDNQAAIKAFLLTFNGSIVSTQKKLIRRDILESHRLRFRPGIIHEDNHLSFFLAKHIRTLAIDRRRTYFYRINPASITNAPDPVRRARSMAVIVTELSAAIDPFQRGAQMEYVLDTLLTTLDGRYYESPGARRALVAAFRSANTPVERPLLTLALHAPRGWLRDKLLHLLIRLYKRGDR